MPKVSKWLSSFAIDGKRLPCGREHRNLGGCRDKSPKSKFPSVVVVVSQYVHMGGDYVVSAIERNNISSSSIACPRGSGW